jgi:methanogenic corrinoid protein MtbC1
MTVHPEAAGEFEAALLEVDRVRAQESLRRMTADHQLVQIIETVIVPVLEKIGDAWAEGELALAQIYMAGRICEELVEQLFSEQAQDKSGPRAGVRLGIGVLRDYHLLGKRIVKSMLIASGYSVIDFGGGLSPESLVDKTMEEEVDILLISTLMLPSALQVKDVVHRLWDGGRSLPVVVGGAPFVMDPGLWKTVGAHAMGRTASEAIAIVDRLSEEMS